MITVLIANIAHFSRSAGSDRLGGFAGRADGARRGPGMHTAKAHEPGRQEGVVARLTMTIAGVAMVLIALILGLLPI